MSDQPLDATKGGRLVLEIRCRRRRHPMAAVHATPEGLVLVGRYVSGRRTRKVGAAVLPTVKFVRETVQPLTGDEPVAVRCDCTDRDLDSATVRDAVRDGLSVVLV